MDPAADLVSARSLEGHMGHSDNWQATDKSILQIILNIKQLKKQKPIVKYHKELTHVGNLKSLLK